MSVIQILIGHMVVSMPCSLILVINTWVQGYQINPWTTGMHVCTLSTVATDTLVLKHQAISIQSTDQIFIALVQFQTKNITILRNNMRN